MKYPTDYRPFQLVVPPAGSLGETTAVDRRSQILLAGAMAQVEPHQRENLRERIARVTRGFQELCRAHEIELRRASTVPRRPSDLAGASTSPAAISDAYFGIVRVEAEVAQHLRVTLRASIAAMARLLPFIEQDVAHRRLSASEFELLMKSPLEVAAIVGANLGEIDTAQRAASESQANNAVASGAKRCPVAWLAGLPGLAILFRRVDGTEDLDRWIAGHHAFIVHDQLMHLGASLLLAEASPDRAAEILTALGTLQEISGIIVKITSNFARGEYVRVVRPHMAQYEEMMSGIYMGDHAQLQAKLARMAARCAHTWGQDRSVQLAFRRYRIGRTAQLEAHTDACRQNIPSDAPSMIGKASAKPTPAMAELELKINPLRKQQAGCPLGFGRNQQARD